MRNALIVGVLCILALLLSEGLASLGQLGHYASKVLLSGTTFGDEATGNSETRHARHDADLGWVNLPDLRIDDIYGSGSYLQTNSQGFRNSVSFAKPVPERKFRIICSGDSFTLGTGVSNPDAWCNSLSRLDHDIEAVNMGQGGYGADQAYLWYKRDGMVLDHDLQVFAVIRDDLDRMLQTESWGYEKPRLRLENGTLTAENVPVPDSLARRKWYLIQRRISEDLALGQLADSVRKFVGRTLTSLTTPAVEEQQEAQPVEADITEPPYDVMAAILSDLAAVNASKNSHLVFVLLPTMEEWMPRRKYEKARKALRQICEQLNIPFLDLTDAFRSHSYSEAIVLFQFGQQGGHYSIEGNRFVAREIMGYLSATEIYSANAETISGSHVMTSSGE